MDIYRSIRNIIPPIHKEGYIFILVFLLATVILGYIWMPLFWLGLLLTVWCALFFRDPERVTPQSKDLVVSPADGKISWVGLSVPPAELGFGTEEMQRISIFMNVFNGHINRAPMSGTVTGIYYRPGEFANAELDKASENNERNAMVLDTAHGKIGVVQVAGFVARRIVCWVKENDTLQAGERFGLIRFGSRLDIYLPTDTKLYVSVGQQTIAGETILASFKDLTTIEEFKVS